MNLNDQSLIILANEFEKFFLQISTFTNEPRKENFFGIDFCQNYYPKDLF